MERREFIATAATTALGAVLAPNLAFADEKADLNSVAMGSSFSLEHKPKPLPFDPKKLIGISEKLIQSHWENNYIGSVKALNGLKKKLTEIANIKETPPFIYSGLKREHLMRTGSVVYHDMYFANLGGSAKVGSDTQKNLSKSFGSFDTWETEFRKMGLGLGGGSGWIVLGYNLHLEMFENYWCWDHLHAPVSALPILVMDMYEHSYQLDYGAAAAKYIDAFFQNINWEEVQSRIEKAKKMKWA